MPEQSMAAKCDLTTSALWRALGEASFKNEGDPPYMERLLSALERNGLEVRLVVSA